MEGAVHVRVSELAVWDLTNRFVGIAGAVAKVVNDAELLTLDTPTEFTAFSRNMYFVAGFRPVMFKAVAVHLGQRSANRSLQIPL